jgi:hypothetical protein
MSAQASDAGLQANSVDLFPLAAIKYFLYSLLSVIAIAVLLDRIVLPELENRGILACENWRLQNEALSRHMLARNHGRYEDPLCFTYANPVSEKCPRSKRILVLGDSYVWGHGVSNWNHLWWRQLQLELNRRGYDVEVIAAGICGANTHMELDWAPGFLQKFHPDMIIWSYVINDPIEFEKNKPPLVPAQPVITKTEYSGLAKLLHPLFPNLVYHLVELRSDHFRAKNNDSKYGYKWETWELRVLQGPNFEAYKQTVARLGKFVSESKIPQFVVTMPSPDRERYQARLEPVKALFKQNKIVCLDLLDDMLAWYRKNYPGVQAKPELVVGVCPVDNHPGPAATHFYARETADFLEKDYKDYLGPKGTEHSNATLNINDWLPASLDLQKLDSNDYLISYPASDDDLPTMPMRRAYVQLNLEYPQKIRTVRISGTDLLECAIAIGEENLDSHEYLASKEKDLGFKKGNSISFTLPEDNTLLSELMISARFTSTSSGSNARQLSVSLIR